MHPQDWSSDVQALSCLHKEILLAYLTIFIAAAQICPCLIISLFFFIIIHRFYFIHTHNLVHACYTFMYSQASSASTQYKMSTCAFTRYISSKSSFAQFLPRSSGSMGSPCPCGVDDISALRKQPLSVSATSVRPKPGDLGGWPSTMI